MPTKLQTKDRTFYLPDWLGFACGNEYNYLFTVSGSPAWSRPTEISYWPFHGAPLWGRAWFGSGTPLSLADSPGKWHFFINYPDSPLSQRMTVPELRKELVASAGHPVIGIIDNPEFPPDSVIYWPDLMLLFTKKNEVLRQWNNVGASKWCWQGRMWTYENGTLTLKASFLSPTPTEIQFSFSGLDLDMLKLLDADFIKSLPLVDVIDLYYSLVSYTKVNPVNRICAELVPSPVTPSAFVLYDKSWSRSTVGVSPFGLSYQWELAVRDFIYKTRQDLHNVQVIEDGKILSYPILIPPDQLMSSHGPNAFHVSGSPYECAWIGDTVNKWIGVTVGLFTMGAPALLSLPITLAQTLVNLTSLVESVNRKKEIEAWLVKHMIGYQVVTTGTVLGKPVEIIKPPEPVVEVVSPEPVQVVTNQPPGQVVDKVIVPPTEPSSKSILPIVLAIAAAIFGS